MMSKVRRVSLASIVPVLWLAAAASADPPAALETFSRPSGETFYALTLDPPADLTTNVPQDVVVLFDTSAGQTSMFREMGMAALEELLGGLDGQSRVKLVAVDLRAVPLHEGFIAPRGDEARAALAQLQQRAPLGSTDMEAVLTAAADAFPRGQQAPGPRSAVYIGGGTSTINLLPAEQLATLVEQLRQRQVDVSSYALGVRTDAPLLAAIANQTGGNLFVAEAPAMADDAEGITVERATQENVSRGRQTGRLLAGWAETEVLWPAASQTAAAISSHLPRSMPPLRADRASVLVGRTAQPLEEPVSVTLTSTDGRQVAWSARPQASNPDHAYLAPLVESAESSGGILLPTIGREGLAEARRFLHEQMEGLTTLAQQAASAGDAATADRIARAVLQYDPENPRAITARNVAARQLTAQPVAAQPGAAAAETSGEELTLLRLAQREDRGTLDPANLDPAPGVVLEDYLGQQAVIRSLIRRDVEEALDQARRIMSDQPSVAVQDLKVTLEQVRRAPELDPETRQQLVDRLEVALREAERRETIVEDIQREEEAERAAARAQLELSERLAREILKEDQLMSRFTALMQEQNFEQAIEVAGFVNELAPGEVVPRAATYDARLVMNDHRGQIVRATRHAAFVDSLHLVEVSGISFPDEPPIVYPPAEVWQALTARRQDRYSAVDLKGQEPAQLEITNALKEMTSLDIFDVPLEEAIDRVERLHNIPIELDDRALQDVGVDTSTLVTAQYQGMSLRSALRLMLRDLELTYIIEDEYLLITTEEEAETRLTTKVYPVADLVLPIIVIPSGVGGGLGGGGLGGGGLGGGLGGGGFGGGGLGGGGLGGGGFGGGGLGGGGFGGGGFFAVPDAPVASGTEETLTLTPAAPAKAASEPVGTTAAPTRSDAVELIEFDASADPDVFWNEYFAANRPSPDAVRATVRRQMETGKTPHVIGLIQAALRNGQPQPWMYEALGIAMQLESRPKEEIERAILSAVDFATGPADLMQIARFLSYIGLDQRALDLYRQVVKVEPLAAEAYRQGLSAAKHADDLDGIRWATIGLLSQAWTAQQAPIKQEALLIAKATLERLGKEGRREEMADYQRELNDALVRDCVIKVSWTGDADVDLLVEEPSGTVCSTHNPRTTAGGVNLGDTYARFDQNAPESFSEVYVCPEAFPGEYRARIRKVWGNLTAGKVTVEVWTNYRTEDVQYERQQVDVGGNDALVKFELKNGRRQEPLAKAQLANAVEQQMFVNRAVLAQHMRGLVDPRVGLRPNEGSLGGAVGIGPDGQPILLRRGGAVGYQPQIIVLPQGTTLPIFSGVVSADRRYVRISTSPMISAIGDVTTFTFAGAGQAVDMDMDMDQDMDAGEDEDVIDADGN